MLCVAIHLLGLRSQRVVPPRAHDGRHWFVWAGGQPDHFTLADKTDCITEEEEEEKEVVETALKEYACSGPVSEMTVKGDHFDVCQRCLEGAVPAFNCWFESML